MFQLEILSKSYLEFCEYQKNLNKKTLKAYRTDLQQFINFMAGSDGELSRTNISNYITYLHKPYRTKTIKRKIACLKAFFNYLEYDEIIEKNPFLKMKVKFQEPSLLPKTMPLITVQTILSTAYQELHQDNNTAFYTKTVLRDIAVLELLFATGARVSELCSLTINDVNLSEGYIKIYGKGSKERIVQIGNEDVLFSLKKYKNIFSLTEKSESFFFINRTGLEIVCQNSLSDS